MAGNEQRIDDVVDIVANKQVIGLAEDLAVLDKQAIDTARSINLLNTATANTKTFAELQKNAAAAEVAQKKATDNIEKTRLAEIKLQQAREKAFDDYEKRLARQTASNVKANSEYLKLVNSLKQAERAAQDAGAKFGTTSNQYILAAERANKFRSQIESIDKPLNTFTNNTDRYAKGIATYFQKAFSGIRILANIIPNFGIGTFFLDAGIALGFLAQQLGIFTPKVKASLTEIEKLQKASADAAVTEAAKLDTLYEASQNLNIPLSERLAIVAQLQKDYPAYFGNLSKEAILAGEAKSAYDSLSQAIINKAVVSAFQKNIEEMSKPLVELIVQEKTAIAQFEKQRADFYKNGGKGRAPQPLQRLIIDEADPELKKVKGLGGNLAPQLQTVDEYKNKIIKKINEAKAGLQQALQDFGVNALLDPDKNVKKPKKIRDDSGKLLSEELKSVQLNEEAILKSQTSTYQEREDATKKFYNDSYDIVKKYTDLGKITQIEASNYYKEFDLKSKTDRLKIEQDAQKELADLLKSGLRGQEDAERASIELIQSAGDEKVLTQAQNAADAEQALAEQYSKGLITQREYQTQLTTIEDEADIDRLDQEIVTAQAIIDVRKGLLSFGIGSAKELQSAEDKLANLKLARTKAGTKAVLDGVKDEAQARQQLHDKEKQLADASINLIQSVVDGGYARQLEALQQVSKQVDDNATKEKDAVNSSLLSAKDKADKNAVIDAKTQLQKEQIAIREKEIKRDQAEFDRAIAIARIIEETAVGIVTALTIPIGGIALASVIGALGAVQLATVLATPLPAFKDGGVTGGGHILWGEAGMEKATLPGGQVQYSNGPTIQEFPKGTIITPHLELMKSIKPDAVKYTGGQEVPWREVLIELRKNRPTKQKGRIIINNNTDHNTIRKNYFK